VPPAINCATGFLTQTRRTWCSSTEAMVLAESVGDPTLSVGLFPLVYAKLETAEYSDVLQWSQRAIDLADGDPPARSGAGTVRSRPTAAQRRDHRRAGSPTREAPTARWRVPPTRPRMSGHCPEMSSSTVAIGA